MMQEGYVTLAGEEGKSALHLTTAGQAEAARMGRAMEETEKLISSSSRRILRSEPGRMKWMPA